MSLTTLAGWLILRFLQKLLLKQGEILNAPLFEATAHNSAQLIFVVDI